MPKRALLQKKKTSFPQQFQRFHHQFLHITAADAQFHSHLLIAFPLEVTHVEHPARQRRQGIETVYEHFHPLFLLVILLHLLGRHGQVESHILLPHLLMAQIIDAFIAERRVQKRPPLRHTAVPAVSPEQLHALAHHVATQLLVAEKMIGREIVQRIVLLEEPLESLYICTLHAHDSSLALIRLPYMLRRYKKNE